MNFFCHHENTNNLSKSEFHCFCPLSARWARMGPAAGKDRVTSSVLLNYAIFIFGTYCLNQCGLSSSFRGDHHSQVHARDMKWPRLDHQNFFLQIQVAVCLWLFCQDDISIWFDKTNIYGISVTFLLFFCCLNEGNSCVGFIVTNMQVLPLYFLARGQASP